MALLLALGGLLVLHAFGLIRYRPYQYAAMTFLPVAVLTFERTTAAGLNGWLALSLALLAVAAVVGVAAFMADRLGGAPPADVDQADPGPADPGPADPGPADPGPAVQTATPDDTDESLDWWIPPALIGGAAVAIVVAERAVSAGLPGWLGFGLWLVLCFLGLVPVAVVKDWADRRKLARPRPTGIPDGVPVVAVGGVFPAGAAPTVDQPSPEPPAYSATAALLNLSGLGLGYLYLRRPVPALASWGVLLVLLLCGALAPLPTPVWLVLAGVFLLGTAIHGGGNDLGHRPLVRPLPAWLALVISGAIVAALVVANAQLTDRGREMVAAARAAHDAGDCEAALAHLDGMGNGLAVVYLVTHDSAELIRQTVAERAACRALLGARAATRDGSFDWALTRYATYAGAERNPVGIGPELAELYETLAGLMDSGAYCDTLAAVELLVRASDEHPAWEEPDAAAEIGAHAVFAPLRDAAADDHPVVLLECARVRYDADGLDAAEPLVMSLRSDYPDHQAAGDDLVHEIVAEVTVREIAAAVAAGGYQALGRSEAAGEAPAGEAQILVGLNFLPAGSVDVLYAGPVSGQVTIGRYDGYECTPSSALTISLPPGEYEILVRPTVATDTSPAPLYGTWNLRAGTSYRGCFDYRREHASPRPLPGLPGN